MRSNDRENKKHINKFDGILYKFFVQNMKLTKQVIYLCEFCVIMEK